MSGADRRSYRFGPRDARGLVLGVRPVQAAIASVTLIAAVGLLRATHGPLRPIVVLLDLVIGLAAAFVPVRGRVVGEWLPVITGFVAIGATGRRREVPGPRLPARPRRPSVFVPFAVVGLEDDEGRTIGAIVDRRLGTLTGALAVSGAAFALVDEPERERAVAGWASVLSALANSPLAPVRVQWIERTVPDRRQALRDRVAAALAPETSNVTGPREPMRRARASYAAFVDAESRDALCHECLVAVSVPGRGDSARRTTSGDRGRITGAAHLSAALASLEERLRSVGLDVGGALTPVGLDAYLDRTFRDSGAPRGEIGPWPIACESKWGSFRTDALVHATYWIAEWPRSEVTSEFLLPLLHEGTGRRTVSLVMEPVNPKRAARRAEHARTSVRADDEVRRRHGFSPSARHSRQNEAVIRREEELASGHAGYRFSGYVTVAAIDGRELERACSRIEQAAALARLDLRRLFGSQDSAFTCTLPVGRGCG